MEWCEGEARDGYTITYKIKGFSYKCENNVTNLLYEYNGFFSKKNSFIIIAIYGQ